MYEIGKVYIWQNQIGSMVYLNGTECSVVARPQRVWCVINKLHAWGQQTDSPCPNEGNYYFAEPGDLRPKDPPPTTGERSVMDLFRVPKLEPA